jgi:hypothetical protein
MIQNKAVALTSYRSILKSIIFLMVLGGGFLLISTAQAHDYSASPVRQAAQWSLPAPRLVMQTRSLGGYRGQRFTTKEIETLIRESAKKYGLPVEKVLRIARCESKLDHMVISRGGIYWGVYQFSLQMWNSMPEGKAKIDRRDAVMNINAAHRHMKAHGYSAWGCK